MTSPCTIQSDKLVLLIYDGDFETALKKIILREGERMSWKERSIFRLVGDTILPFVLQIYNKLEEPVIYIQSCISSNGLFFAAIVSDIPFTIILVHNTTIELNFEHFLLEIHTLVQQWVSGPTFLTPLQDFIPFKMKLNDLINLYIVDNSEPDL